MSIDIKDDVIIKYARDAVLSTEGVASFASGFGQRSIKLDRDENELKINVYVDVLYGVHIPSVAWDIQENVKDRIDKMTGLKADAVNIHIQGVVKPEENDE